MKGKDLRIVYMGTPEFAVAPLKALVNNGYNIVKVITVPDKPQGRGLQLGHSAVKEYAMQANLSILQPVKLKDADFLKELDSLNADLFIVVAFRMLPAEVWKMPKLGTFNLHASLLPEYRGAAPINWAIINGETETGVTTFLIDEQIDTGNILLQKKINIEQKETIGTLYDKLMDIGANLVVETVDGLAEGNIIPHPQNVVNNNLHDAPKLNRDNCSINWNLPAKQIELLIRGLSPYPAATSTIIDKEGKEVGVKIFMAEAYNSQSDITNSVGTINSNGKTELTVTCGNGTTLKVEELQLAGKKRMKIKDFLAGFRNPDNYKFKVE